MNKKVEDRLIRLGLFAGTFFVTFNLLNRDPILKSLDEREARLKFFRAEHEKTKAKLEAIQEEIAKRDAQSEAGGAKLSKDQNISNNNLRPHHHS